MEFRREGQPRAEEQQVSVPPNSGANSGHLRGETSLIGHQIRSHGTTHGALGLHEAPACDDHVQVWGDAVETLWRIAMTFETKISAWNTLTCRLLLWRAIVGEDASVVGEWARREVIGLHTYM